MTSCCVAFIELALFILSVTCTVDLEINFGTPKMGNLRTPIAM